THECSRITDHSPGFDNIAHLRRIGRGEDICGCATPDLASKGGAAREVQRDPDVGMSLLELLFQLRERLLQRGSREHDQFPPRGTVLRGIVPPITRRDEQRPEQQHGHPSYGFPDLRHHYQNISSFADQQQVQIRISGSSECSYASPGVSTTTWVLFTTATARTPGSSPSSRTASVLINETTRCGPHCISTCAITRSATTLVTNPTNRLRADLSTSEGS